MINDMMRKIATALTCAILLASSSCARDEAASAGTTIIPDTTSPTRDSTGIILFLGTSLTAGYGVGAEFAYPAVIQQKLDSAGFPLRVINAGISGETSAGGLRRLDWSLQQPIDILVLELGANDGLRGLSIAALRDNLEEIIERTRQRYPDAAIVIAGMEAPPNLGVQYTQQFRRTFRTLADQHDAALVPFLLADVAAIPELNQNDGIHPNIAGQKRVAENVWRVLLPVIRQQLAN
jgi:acyl-CoA thioesterase I